jgi:imidazolonepropionase-like amidohydrolase
MHTPRLLRAARPALPLLLLGALLGATAACRATAPAPAPEAAPATAAEATLAFVDVTVIPDGTRAVPGQTVLVAGGRIVAVGPAADTAVPGGARRIEGKGRFLMAGLADMHLHLPAGAGGLDDAAGQTLALQLANGVTTARALIAAPGSLALRERVARGEVDGPRLLVAAPSLNKGSVKDAADVRAQVRAARAAGYDVLKTHGGLSREVYDALVEEARAQDLRLSGHVTPEVGLPAALAAGQQVEHLDGYLAELLPEGDPARAQYLMLEVREPVFRMDAGRLPALARRTREAGVWNTPTLSLFAILAGAGDLPALEARPELRYAPAAARAKWRQALTTPELLAAPAEGKRRYAELRREAVRQLHAAGAGLLVGSDSPQLFNVPGFALHREMEELAAAGLPPSAVLVAATHAAARYLGEEQDWGRVAVGQRADLLLLKADPLADVRHTRDPEGVLVAGRWLPREQLEAALARVAGHVAAAK